MFDGAGDPIKDDLFIILGVRKAGDAASSEGRSEVEDAVIKLMQNELGLEVILAGSTKIKLGTSIDKYTKAEEILESNRFQRGLVSSTRRPAVFRRLKVTRKSLRHWLQRRMVAKRCDIIN